MTRAEPGFSPSWASVRRKRGMPSPPAPTKWIRAPASGREKRPVPGVAGRLAASAVALHDQVFIFGGYVVDSQGGETTVSDLNVFVPVENRYYRGKDIPEPVDDAVVGLYRDRYIFVIGGWSTSKGAAVRNVQIYDTDKDVWMQGHTDSWYTRVRPCWDHPRRHHRLRGRRLSEPERPPIPNTSHRANAGWAGYPFRRRLTSRRFAGLNCRLIPATRAIASRPASDAQDKKATRIYFSGGTDNPYNYTGIGYNGQPAEPSPVTFAFNVHTLRLGDRSTTTLPNPPWTIVAC